mmetsp:Transcript_145614/g.363204  ORF Transcript_145614/g.363204 Transcript_145614/m.363204 type:complete len:111 (-) Transcript_145614:2505-2837(-)
MVAPGTRAALQVECHGLWQVASPSLNELLEVVVTSQHVVMPPRHWTAKHVAAQMPQATPTALSAAADANVAAAQATPPHRQQECMVQMAMEVLVASRETHAVLWQPLGGQ